MERPILILCSSLNMATTAVVASVQMLMLVVLCGVLAAQAQTDEDQRRPYKFGFNIENMQHRQEEKDERGIIMGEFGFITADGWYLTTIYATDEEGRFKILGRKRERVGPPLDPYSQRVTTARPLLTAAPITISSPRPFQVPSTTFRPTTFRPFTSTAFAALSTVNQQATQRPGAFQGIRGCGSCIIPTTTPRPVAGSFVSTTAGFRPTSSTGSFGQGGNQQPGGFGVSPSGGNNGFNPAGGTGGGSPGFNPLGAALRPNPGQNRPGQGSRPGSGPSGGGGFGGTTPAAGFRPIVTTPSGRPFQPTQGGFGGQPGSGFNRPSVPPGGYPPTGGSPQGGRRPGVTDSQLGGSALNYRFNYTAGYHGHHETGYKDGSKVGGYFVNNRDGVGQRVVYEANEFGYQPNISQVQLSQYETPRKDTERNSVLPSFNEFLWFRR